MKRLFTLIALLSVMLGAAAQAQMLKAIRKSNANAIMDYADRLRDYAVNCAAELIQVAAMCEKTVRTVRGE